MSKKLFSLIYGGDSAHVAPGARILPSDSFSKLMTIEEILERIDKDSEQSKSESLKEAEQLREQAKKEGFEAGFKEWLQQTKTLEKEIGRVHEEIGKIAVPLALQAAKKIVGREIQVNPETTAEIIKNSLHGVKQHKKILIYVNPQELVAIDKERPRLKEVFENLESLSIRPRDDIQPGGCMIETEGGIINAQLENQWQVMEQVFTKLMRAEVEEKEKEVQEKIESDVAAEFKKREPKPEAESEEEEE